MGSFLRNTLIVTFIILLFAAYWMFFVKSPKKAPGRGEIEKKTETM